MYYINQLFPTPSLYSISFPVNHCKCATRPIAASGYDLPRNCGGEDGRGLQELEAGYYPGIKFF